MIRQLHFDVGQRPFLVLFELTKACSLACRHCRAEAGPQREPDELSTREVTTVLDDLAGLGPPRPIVVLTGGDPLERDDILTIVRHGASRGLRMAVSPAATPRTAARLASLREAGAVAVSLSLDGATMESHDAFRRTPGSFEWTLTACRAAKAAGVHLQVNTTLCRDNLTELTGISELVSSMAVGLWSVFFMVPVGRGRDIAALSANDTERTLGALRDLGRNIPLKTTEAPQFRRLLIQGSALRQPDVKRPPLAVSDARGVVFISRRGDVQPSGFLPIIVGNVRERPLTDIYASSPLLRAIRDPERLRGRCGRCEFRSLCGGSRAQAFARSGDPLGEDPTCPYVPDTGDHALVGNC